MLRAVQCFELLHQPTQQLAGILRVMRSRPSIFNLSKPSRAFLPERMPDWTDAKGPPSAPSVSKAMAE